MTNVSGGRMNSFIENLNQWGGDFLSFAWPMLWQSSLLIIVLLAIDFLIRGKIRASIRYALWLVVLVKLCLPPALALPTGAAWWLFPGRTAVRPPAIPRYTVSYDTASSLMDSVPETIPAPVLPSPEVDGAGWVLLGCGLMSAGLLLWLALRWWQISRKVSGAMASEEFTSLLDEARRRAGLRSAPQLRLVSGRMSPAVCGLYCPVILLPRVLAERLSAAQLRAVLLHEAFHLRRKDVWVNCAQALLQIVYWWHPLLWLANARIRRLREEAVDDAVMLALRGEAENYAPTLLAVAKLALSRPLMSLGLVGIMESRTALRKRIERLVNFRPVRKAGLTFLSLGGIFVFGAVALPMGEAPAPAERPDSTEIPAVEQRSLTLKVDPDIFVKNVEAQAAASLLTSTNDYTAILLELLRTEGVDCTPPHGIKFNTQTGEITTQNIPDQLAVFREVIEQLNRTDGHCALPLGDNPLRKRLVVIEARIYQMSSDDFDNFVSDLRYYHNRVYGDDWWSATPEQFKQLLDNLESSGLQLIQRPRIQTASGITAEFFVGNGTNNVEFDCKPYAADGYVDLALRGAFVHVTGASAALTNNFRVSASAEDRGGLVLRVKNYGGDTDNNLLAAISVEMVTNPPPARIRQQLQTTKQATVDVAGQSGRLVADGKLLYEMGKFDEAEKRLAGVLALDPQNQAAHYYMNLVSEAKAGRRSGMIQTSNGRKTIVDKLNRIQFDHFGPNVRWPLKEVVNELNQLTADLDSGKTGIHFFITDGDQKPQPTVDPSIESLMNGDGWKETNINSVKITINPALTNATLAEVLDAIVVSADKPIEYTILDTGVVFSPGPENQKLYARTYRVHPVVFLANLRKQAGSETNAAKALLRIFSSAGLDLTPPEAIFYNDGLGLLYVRATEPDQKAAEKIIVTLTDTPPQIHIKAWFIEVPKGTLNGFGISGNMIGITNQPDHFTGILTSENSKTVLRTLELRAGAEALAEPEVTTSSGRQTEMRSTKTITVITNFAFVEGSDSQSNSIIPQTAQMELGPVVDVIPNVLADDYTIDLTIIASENEFLGYDKSTNISAAYTSRGQKINLPTISPSFAVRKAMANIQLWDGQTVVLGGMKPRFYDGGKEVSAEPDYFAKTKAARGRLDATDKELLVLITVNLVDRAGNRIHSDEDMPFAKNSIPPQDGP